MEILNRFTNAVLFSAEVATMKELLLAAINAKADLREANLRGSNLYGADLYGSNLREADLRGSNLREADLRGSNLREADLREADLREANLRGSNLRGADLREADLREANLYGADLREANAKINGHSVISINGLTYPILITDTHLRAGCQNHTFADWRAMTTKQIIEMDGKNAVVFYPVLINLIDSLCKDRENQGDK